MYNAGRVQILDPSKNLVHEVSNVGVGQGLTASYDLIQISYRFRGLGGLAYDWNSFLVDHTFHGLHK